jgi:hypothetical protein
MRPDGSPHRVCASHGGLTPNPRVAVLTDRGREIISATAKATWARYRELKADVAGRPSEATSEAAKASSTGTTQEAGAGHDGRTISEGNRRAEMRGLGLNWSHNEGI